MPESGRIVTFYSFKGGVGRTMALANTAFIAALAGRRVLVMDWDLEAPGLAYYFRGMQEGSGGRTIREAPGVLNMVWEWSTAIGTAASPAEVDALAKRFAGGAPFDVAVRPLITGVDLDDGCLHIIGAGSAVVATPEPRPYEEALARFDWSDFFDHRAGGAMLSSLRDWARASYDLVLVDSRTGFADVAGICTMQMPDVVALCFVFNRQNIDGIAQVAGAIRSKRGQSVTVRYAPMRTARENTPEEADARAHARRELVRRGGAPSEAVDGDLGRLAVRQTPNVPFYETVAAVAADRPRTDPLALNYVAFASELLGEEFPPSQVDEDWAGSVRFRLQPQRATADYVLKLRSSSPERAFQEVSNLVGNALAAVDDDHDADYLRALVDLALSLAQQDGLHEGMRLFTDVIDLLRALAERDGSWKPLLADVIADFLGFASDAIDPNEELVLVEEAYSLLLLQDEVQAKRKRLANRRRAARIHLNANEPAAATAMAGEITELLKEIRAGRRPAGIVAELLSEDLQLQMLRGDIALAGNKAKVARHYYEAGLKVLDQNEAAGISDRARLTYELHVRLARLKAPVMTAYDAATHAVRASSQAAAVPLFVVQLVELGSIVLDAAVPALASRFVLQGLAVSERLGARVAALQGRSPQSVERFANFAVMCHALIRSGGDEDSDQAISALAEASLSILEHFMRTLGRRPAKARSFSSHALGDLDDAFAGDPAVQPMTAARFSTLVAMLDRSVAKRGTDP